MPMLRGRLRKKYITLFWMALACLVAAVCYAVPTQGELQATEPLAQLRRPIAAAFVDESGTLCVANQRSGSVALVDVETGRLREERTVGKHLSDLAVLPDHKHVLLVDDERHELIVLSFDGNHLHNRTRLAVASYPVSVAVSPNGKRASVACQWSRCVQVVDLSSSSSPTPELHTLHTVRLPFAPRCQCVLPGSSRVVVADAFGGRLAIVDTAQGELIAVHETKGHNLRGLAVSAEGQRLLVAHQILNQQIPILEEKIWRGFVMTNVVSSFPLNELTKPGVDLAQTGTAISLKGSGQGAGDPAGIAVLGQDHFAVALGGVNEVALVSEEGEVVHRILVGQRPTAVVAGASGQSAVVVNTFDDSLSVIDPRAGFVRRTISLGKQPVLSSADRGELLFFDAHLSRDSWFSCHSCHTDGHSNGLLADTLGDGTYGTPKKLSQNRPCGCRTHSM